MSADLVKQGKLPPLMERLPVPEDVHVVPPPNEIGTYGGTWRATANSKRYLQKYANGHPLQLNADGASYVERVAKSMNISEDGRVYTFTPPQRRQVVKRRPAYLRGLPLHVGGHQLLYQRGFQSRGPLRVGLGPDIPLQPGARSRYRRRGPIRGDRRLQL